MDALQIIAKSLIGQVLKDQKSSSSCWLNRRSLPSACNNHCVPLTRQQFYDFLYPQVNGFLKLQHAGEDAKALPLFENWLSATLDALGAGRAPAGTELPEDADPAELWEAVYYRCCFLLHNLRARNRPLDDHGQQREVLSLALAELAREPLTPAGRVSRDYARLAVLLVGFKDLDEPLSTAAIRAMIDALPEEYQDHQIWHPLSVLAFDTGNSELMDLCFEHETIHPHSKFPQAAWQRINLLHLILNGRVERQDIVETLNVYTLPSQFNELRRRMWPRLQALGLIDASLEQLLAQREEAAAHAEIDFHVPRIDSIRSHAPD